MPEIIVSTEYQRAIELDAEIKSKAQLAQKSLYEVCKGLKEMRDGKYYKELGYQNFNDYVEQEIEIRRSQAYNYISIVENLSADFVQSTGHFGTQKLYLLSRLDEASREKIIEENDLENTTVKELEQKIKALEDVNTALENKNTELEDKNIELKKRYEECSDKLDDAVDENKSLLVQLDELENRPVDVAVSDNSHEIENIREAMKKADLQAQNRISELENQNLNEHNEHKRELKQVKEEYEQKLAEAYASAEKSESTPDMKEVFKVYFSNAIDSTKRLIDFINSQEENGSYKEKALEFFNRMVAGLED